MAERTKELTEMASREDGGGGASRGSGRKARGILLPAAATAAAAAAAGLAAKKAPDLMKKLRGEADEEAEELGRKGAEGAKERLGSAGGLAGKLFGGSEDGQKGGKTRRLPIQRWTDVAVPVEKAYRAWTQFEEFPKFMHRVLEVKQEERDKIHWREKIWFSTREWEGEITERRSNDRIAWKSVSGTHHSGIVSFHKLDSNLTRVLVTVDFVPQGVIEKMASGMRFVKRAVEADLARFKAYVELGDAKGLEYRSKPTEMEQHREDGDAGRGDEQDDEGRETESRGDSSDEQQDGNGREEREKRREERRKALAAG
jgi:uncharacterized protein YndB with AHSA1/START domain